MGLFLQTAAAPTKRARNGEVFAFNTAVLIVEDQALIRMNAVQMVEDAGYLALQAPNANDAIAILKSRRDIGAVFTDLHMSGSRSGLRLAHAVRGRWPPIYLIVTSALPAEPDLPPDAHFVRKPYENAR